MDRAVIALAAEQHGVFSRVQVTKLGLTRGMIAWRLKTGAWAAVTSGIYTLPGFAESWQQRLMIACLACGGVASHRAACRVHGFPRFIADRIELSVPYGRWRQYPGATLHRVRWPLDGADSTKIDGIPVTSAARTLIDIAALVPRQILEYALDHGIKNGQVSVKALYWHLAKAGKRPGIATLRELVRARDPSERPPDSVLAREVFNILVRKIDGLETEYPVVGSNGRDYRIDIAIPQLKIAIEADGRTWHDGESDRDRDAEKDNALGVLGWLVLRFRWSDLARPDHIVATVQRAVVARARA